MRPADVNFACPHCSDGHGQFVDAQPIAVLLAPDALLTRVAIESAGEASAAPPADERPVLRPPDPTLLALRCALIR